MTWPITIALNVTLAILMYWRGWHHRFHWLFAAFLYAIFADQVLLYWYHHIGYYSVIYWTHQCFMVALNYLISLESFLWQMPCIWVPAIIYAVIETVAFTAQISKHNGIANSIHHALGIPNILLTLWYGWCLRKESPNA